MRRQHRSLPQQTLLGAATAVLTALTLAGCATVQAGNDATGVDPTGITEPQVQVTEGEATLETETETETEATDAAAESTEPERESNVTVAIVGAASIDPGSLEVRSFVTDFVGDGTCKVTATDSTGVEYTAEAEALPDAKSTTCPTATLVELPVGSYKVTVEFDAGERYGVSEATTVEVAE